MKYHSVKEVAKRLNISVQGVHYKIKNFDKDFKEKHTKVLSNNKLMIDEIALEYLISSSNLKDDVETIDNTELKEVKDFNSFEEISNHKYVIELKQQIEKLENKIEQKDKIIADTIKNYKSDIDRLLNSIQAEQQMRGKALEQKESKTDSNIINVGEVVEDDEPFEQLQKDYNNLAEEVKLLKEKDADNESLKIEIEELKQKLNNQAEEVTTDAPRKKSFFDKIFKK